MFPVTALAWLLPRAVAISNSAPAPCCPAQSSSQDSNPLRPDCTAIWQRQKEIWRLLSKPPDHILHCIPQTGGIAFNTR